MPWSESFGLKFTESSIHENVPNTPGVFGVYNAQGWVFIAKSKSLRNSLFNCFVQRSRFWPGNEPTGYTFESCSPTEAEELRDQLILEYSPYMPPVMPEVPTNTLSD